jgi:hypothetical protein
MTNLSTKIKLYANQEIDFSKDVLLQDDGKGAYIKEWNLDIAKPTLEQLEQYDVQADFNIAMADLRQKRNALLSATDYLALSDNTMSDDVKVYRQALRDITEGVTTKEQVEAVVFPNKPQGII